MAENSKLPSRKAAWRLHEATLRLRTAQTNMTYQAPPDSLRRCARRLFDAELEYQDAIAAVELEVAE